MTSAIDNLTIGDVKQLAGMFGSPGRTHSFKVGEKYLIFTVSFFYTGRITSITESDIVLEEAAWIAHTDRLEAAFVKGKLKAVEPCPDPVGINREAIVSFSIWKHDLPRAVI